MHSCPITSPPPLKSSEEFLALQKEALDLPVLDLSPSETDRLDLAMSGLAPSAFHGIAWSGDEAIVGGSLALRDAEGVLLAILEVDCVGDGVATGRVRGMELPTRYDFAKYRAVREHPVSQAKAGRKVVFCPQVPSLRQVQEWREIGGHFVLAVGISTTASGELTGFSLVRCLEQIAIELGTASIVVVAWPSDAEVDQEILQCEVSAALGDQELPWNREPDPKFSPEVEEEIARSHPRREERGLTIFFTGLSGSGKSTVARNLQVRLLEWGGRTVSLLDGDLIRKNLSSELTFSKEHRDISVRRIGYVAAEITRHHGIAICCPIAPYEATRRAVRGMIEPHGEFLLVYISTPLEECERRDRKGLYAKARAGIIPEFTGISDVYEVPSDADLVIDTTGCSAEEATESVLEFLRRGHFLPQE